jgi:hypothetical protein
MEFSIPDADNEEEAEEMYEGIVNWAEEQRGSVVDRRIHRVNYYDGDRDRVNIVSIGDEVPQVGERAFAILESETHDMYMICTPGRGVVQGAPVMIGDREVKSTTEFEN